MLSLPLVATGTSSTEPEGFAGERVATTAAEARDVTSLALEVTDDPAVILASLADAASPGEATWWHGGQDVRTILTGRDVEQVAAALAVGSKH